MLTLGTDEPSIWDPVRSSRKLASEIVDEIQSVDVAFNDRFIYVNPDSGGLERGWIDQDDEAGHEPEEEVLQPGGAPAGGLAREEGTTASRLRQPRKTSPPGRVAGSSSSSKTALRRGRGRSGEATASTPGASKETAIMSSAASNYSSKGGSKTSLGVGEDHARSPPAKAPDHPAQHHRRRPLVSKEFLRNYFNIRHSWVEWRNPLPPKTPLGLELGTTLGGSLTCCGAAGALQSCASLPMLERALEQRLKGGLVGYCASG